MVFSCNLWNEKHKRQRTEWTNNKMQVYRITEKTSSPRTHTHISHTHFVTSRIDDEKECIRLMLANVYVNAKGNSCLGWDVERQKVELEQMMNIRWMGSWTNDIQWKLKLLCIQMGVCVCVQCAFAARECVCMCVRYVQSLHIHLLKHSAFDDK